VNADFRTYWVGQAVSSLGSSVTKFALPLAVYKLTGSALDLGMSTAATYLPYLLFGLVLGAWSDRMDRKRLMMGADLGRACLVATIPLQAAFGTVSAPWIYAVAFGHATLSILFEAGQFGAIPSLVGREDLVAANGRIQATLSLAQVCGPLIAGALVALVPLWALFLVDAATFLVSASSLALIRTRFDSGARRGGTSLREDVAEGLRFVLGHPVLRNISVMMALVNFVHATVSSQLVAFATRRFAASDAQVGILYSAASAGVVATSLVAGSLRRRWKFATVALGALMLQGLCTVALACAPSFELAVAFWALASGLGTLFNINTGSLRQAIVPEALFGRVITIAGVIAWSAIPLGALAGGYAIERTGNIAVVYTVCGTMVSLIACGFWFTALREA
jgi:MFS family permease